MRRDKKLAEETGGTFGERSKHPSFGMVGFSRASVGGSRRERLFGSSLAKHYNVIMLRVHQAFEEHHLSQDWRHAQGAPLIEVEMSEAQFASLLTTMNMGDGVPCTIRYVAPGGSGKVESAPDADVEVDKVRKGFEQNIKELVEDFETLKGRAKEILGTAKSSKAERDEILKLIERAAQDLSSNFGFVIEQFNEATEKVITQAKAEVDAFVTNAAKVAGLDRLKELASDSRGGGALALIEGKARDEEKKR